MYCCCEALQMNIATAQSTPTAEALWPTAGLATVCGPVTSPPCGPSMGYRVGAELLLVQGLRFCNRGQQVDDLWSMVCLGICSFGSIADSLHQRLHWALCLSGGAGLLCVLLSAVSYRPLLKALRNRSQASSPV